MFSVVTIRTPAKSQALLSVEEAKLALNLTTSTDPTVEEQVQMFNNWASDEIAAIADRVFGRETVTEVFTNIDETLEACGRIYLSRWPVFIDDTNPFVVNENGTELTAADYSLDTKSGRLTKTNQQPWNEPVTIDYTGGYLLPFEGPQALKRAAILMTREAYYAAQRGDASVRMISHKSSRIIYFDPNAKMGAAAQGGGTQTSRAVQDLVKHYIRYPV